MSEWLGLELVKRYRDAAKTQARGYCSLAQQVDLDQCFRPELVELLQSGREAGHRRGELLRRQSTVVASRPREDEIRTSCLRVLDASNASEVHEN